MHLPQAQPSISTNTRHFPPLDSAPCWPAEPLNIFWVLRNCALLLRQKHPPLSTQQCKLTSLKPKRQRPAMEGSLQNIWALAHVWPREAKHSKFWHPCSSRASAFPKVCCLPLNQTGKVRFSLPSQVSKAAFGSRAPWFFLAKYKWQIRLYLSWEGCNAERK